MNGKTSLYASHPHRFAGIPERDLRLRAIGQVGAIATLLALMLVATLMSGCDPVASVGASAHAANTPSASAAPNAATKTGFDWRRADPVTYTPEELDGIDNPNAD